MKLNIEFYPHFANSDQHAKFKMLRVEYGWKGEGRFWALNNRIAQAEECCLNISKKYNKAAIASDLGFNLVEFDSFIDFLINDCELIKECSKGVITTDIIQEAFQKVMQDRGKARARYKRASPEKVKTSGEKVYKGKESKVKEKKETYNTPKKYKFDPLTVRPDWFPINDLQDIIYHRKNHSKKPPETQRAYQGIFNQIQKAVDEGYSISECVDTMCSRGWISFNAGWMPDRQATIQPETPKGRMAKELLRRMK